MKEEFRAAVGYEGLYEISNLGNFRSLDRVTNVKDSNHKRTYKGENKVGILSKNGALFVNVSKDGVPKSERIHNLVAAAFLGFKLKGKGGDVIRHLNGNKTDNVMTNLEIISHRESLSGERKGGSSKYAGVSWHKRANKWLCSVTIEDKLIHLGYYTTEEEASNTYQAAVSAYKDNGTIPESRSRKSSSEFKGVYFSKSAKNWRAQTIVNGRTKYLGQYKTELEAAAACAEFITNKNNQ